MKLNDTVLQLSKAAFDLVLHCLPMTHKKHAIGLNGLSRYYELYGFELCIVYCIYKFVLFYVSAIGQIPKSGKDSAGSLEGNWRSQVKSWSAPISHHPKNANNNINKIQQKVNCDLRCLCIIIVSLVFMQIRCNLPDISYLSEIRK